MIDQCFFKIRYWTCRQRERERRNMFLDFMLCLLTMFPFTLIEAVGSLQGSSSRAMYDIAKPRCQNSCGDVAVPYPFGVGNNTGCSLDNSFYVTCNTTYKPPKLFLGNTNIQIYNISDSELQVQTVVSYHCYDQYMNASDNMSWSFSLERHFTFSEKNKFTVIGCDDYALIQGKETDDFSNGCFGLCTKRLSVLENGSCTGRGCCQTSITKGLRYYDVTLKTFKNHVDVWHFNPCGYAFLGQEGSFQFRGALDIGPSNASVVAERITSTVRTMLDWVISPNQSCSTATECKGNSYCYGVDGGGYRCRCKSGYEGNPYLGCQDINECDDKINIRCYGKCVNTTGNYSCICWPGYTGDASTEHGCVKTVDGSKFPVTIFTLALVFGLIAILSGVTGILFAIRKRKLIKLREKFFEQNGGVFLKQKLKAPGISEEMIMFSSQQLLKATDNYSEEQIIGRGGYGIVYKGILPDKRVVAIKKSKFVDNAQAEQFINEVLILTQVIHRNVVKVLGCCLEEEVPVLVYEFISNNTLYYHIHHTSGGMSWLSWENRLRIADEAASALSYLHSQATMPIIHRDVKSSNILLDDNYTTKISDFGASRLVPLDHDQVTTLVQGTLGYLDPEYFQTSQLNDKSDVYSFGVVLAELLTGQKPLSAYRTNEEKNLATYFVKALKENRLLEIVEPRVLREGTPAQLQVVGDLVRRCLNLHGNDRPTMREVAMELEGLKKFNADPCKESGCLINEVEEPKLHDDALSPCSTSEFDSGSYSYSYSGITSISVQENKPR